MKGIELLIVGIALVIVALIALVILGSHPWTGRPGTMMRGPFGAGGPSGFRSNGERIYYTATSSSGDPITFSGGPHWFQVHGGGCVDCHGPEGRGGYPVPMTNQVAPDIRYNTLASEKHEEMEHPPYTEALLKQAITKGLDPAGKPLNYAMPRWEMSERDLDDLVDYLKTLDGR